MTLRASPCGPLSGTADIPGDKSTSHRALILGALASGTTRITGLLESQDVLETVHALAAFGIEVAWEKGGCWTVAGGAWRPPGRPIDCGNSGTAGRLLIGAAAGFERLEATFTGDASLSRRPMRRIIEPLRRMGAKFAGGDTLPLTLHGAALGGIAHRNEPASAQVKSAILLAGLRTAGPVTVVEPVPSRDHTEIMLGEFGCDVRVEETREGRAVSLGENRALMACDIAIAADPSSAAFALTAAAIVPGSRVAVSGVLTNPLRTGLLGALREMGAEVTVSDARIQSGEQVAEIRITHRPLRPIEVAAERIPAMIDEIPLLAVAAAFANGESVIHGLGELRHKESDRLSAIDAGLIACGVSAVAEGDSLRIVGGEVRGGATIGSAGDHRIAMAFAVLGLAAREPVVVDGAEMIATSFPGFAVVMRSIGAKIDELE